VKLAHFGTFDVANYGDLLFPRIVEHELGAQFDEFRHISPIGGQPYDDVPASISVRRALSSGEKFDAVMIGGGNILHGRPTGMPEYASVSSSAYPDLWLAAARIAREQQIPLVVNSPGVASPLAWPETSAVRVLRETAEYFAVRDVRSADLLTGAGGVDAVVPDTALLVNQAIPFAGQASLDALEGQLAGLRVGEYFVAHANDRYLGAGVHEVASALDELARLSGTRPVLVVIGAVQGDAAVVQAIAREMTSDPVIVREPRRVGDIAHLIAGAAFYAGSSMHGFITAVSFGVPAHLSIPSAKHHKFAGFAEHVGAASNVHSTWTELVASAAAGDLAEFLRPAAGGAAEQLVRQHWDRVRSSLSTASPERSNNVLAVRAVREAVVLRNRTATRTRTLRTALRRTSR